MFRSRLIGYATPGNSMFQDLVLAATPPAPRCCGREPPNAGFSALAPWLPLSEGWRDLNAARQLERPGSILRLYQALLALRRREEALRVGDYALLGAAGGLLAFQRSCPESCLAVVLDLEGSGGVFPLDGGQILLSTSPGRVGERLESDLHLNPHEGAIVRRCPARPNVGERPNA